MLLYTPESVYRLDQAAVSTDGFSEIELMQRAGEAVWRSISQRWPQLQRITVFAGSATMAAMPLSSRCVRNDRQLKCKLLVQGELDRQSPTSRHFRQLWEQAGGHCEDWQGQSIDGELIIDGLLGIGLQRDLDEHWQALVRRSTTARRIAWRSTFLPA